MKNIIILTYDFREFNFFTNDPQPIIGGYEKFILQNIKKGQSITVYFGPSTMDNPDQDTSALVADIEDIQGEKLILTHRIKKGIKGDFDVATRAFNDDRLAYEKLLNANFQGELDTQAKQEVFDDVWNYFSKRVERLLLVKLKEVYFNECIADSQWKKLPEQFATTIIINKWNELSEKPFDSQNPDYDVFYKLFEDTWQ